MEDPSVGQPNDGSQSPTQANSGRSYDRYDGLRDTQERRNSIDDLVSRLSENASGAVNFDSINSDDADLESLIGNGSQYSPDRARFQPLDDDVPAVPDQEPTTPANRNPFAKGHDGPQVAVSQFLTETPFTGGFKFGDATPASQLSQYGLPGAIEIETPHTGASSVHRPQFPESVPVGDQTPMPPTDLLSSQSTPGGITPFANKTAAPTPFRPRPTPKFQRQVSAPVSMFTPVKKQTPRPMFEPRAQSLVADPDSDLEANLELPESIMGGGPRPVTKPTMPAPPSREIIEIPSSTQKVERPSSEPYAEFDMSQQTSRPASQRSQRRPPTASQPSASDKSALEIENEFGSSPSIPQSLLDATGGIGVPPGTKSPSSSAAQLPRAVHDAARKPANMASAEPQSSNVRETIPETSPSKFPASGEHRPHIVIASDALDGETFTPDMAGDVYSSQPELSKPRTSPEKSKKSSQCEKESKDTLTIDISASSPPAILKEPRQSPLPCDSPPLASVSVSSSSLSSLSVTPQPTQTETPATADDGLAFTRAKSGADGDSEDTAEDQGMDVEGVSSISSDGSPVKSRYRRSAKGRASDAETPTADAMPSFPRGVKRGLSEVDPASSQGSSGVSGDTPTTERRTSRSPLKKGHGLLARGSPASLFFAPPVRASVRVSRTDSAKSTFVAPTNAHGLFAGMVFSVTSQSKRPGEKAESLKRREKEAASIQDRITKAGGRVLPDGFDALFEAPAVATRPVSLAQSRSALDDGGAGLCLRSGDADTAFTAMISDGHSRKQKYMQALALGIPCLAPRWVTTCIDRNRIVDWMPYLVSSGESSYLGGAICSRYLVPYDAQTARLVDIVRTRKQLLRDQRILIYKKSSQDPYIFLAHVLGASLWRANTLEEAREHIRAMEDTGRPFDWIYTGGNAGLGGIFGDRGGRPAPKKRRSSALSPALARVKLLSDEGFIQSLIFGQLIEEDNLGV